MSSFLITGGVGFIGSNIALRLVRGGHKVTILDNFATGRGQNIAEMKNDVRLIRGDIRNLKTVELASRGIDYVLHQAALPSVQRSVKDPKTTHEINAGGTLNVLLAARKANVKRVVYASSSSVYGETPTLPKHEGMTLSPISPYAVSKLAGELYCRAFYKVYGLETVCLRYFNVYGPRQDPNSEYAAVIPKFITAILAGQRPIIFGDGNQSRDFTFVEDVVEANILATKAKARGATGEVFNIAVGQRTTVNQLVATLNKILGTTIKPKYTKQRPGDIKHSLADIRKAQKVLDYKPRYDLEAGLRETMAWFKS